jgi:hypothetical protein
MGISQGESGRRAPGDALGVLHAARSAAAASPQRTLTASDTAWIAALPTAAIALPAVVLLGPPLGSALLAPPATRFWEIFHAEVRPEPTEHARYLIALLVPLLLAALTVAGTRLRPRPWRASLASDLLVTASQAALVAFVVVCLLQEHEQFGPLYPPGPLIPRLLDYFKATTLVVAAAGTLGVVAALTSRRLSASLAAWTRETRGRRLAAGGLALAAIVLWLLPGIYTERTIRVANFEVLYHLQFTIDETYAVLDGRTPLVDFAAQYGSLWPYPYAVAMSLLGDSIGVWVTLALATTGLGMLSLFAVLRRAAHSSIRGLLLFLPILATSFAMIGGTLQRRYSFETYFGTFPMRYAGPSILAWLVARHLAGAAPRRAWPLFLAAGLVALNNADAGLPALGATVAAVVWGQRRLTRAGVMRLAREAAAGVLASYALVSLLTLARAGALPDVGLLLRFSRLFARSGFGMFPLPQLGLYLAIYVTFVAAIGAATARALRAEPDRLLTGMLAWSGVFGLGASAYFVGRSTPDNLAATFLPWSFALALLLIPAVESLRTATWRRPPLAATICVFGSLVAACSLAQTPTPWEQAERLQQTVGAILARPHGQGFIAQHTHPGEHVAILGLLGHRVGVNADVVNVSPYSSSLVIASEEQLDDVIAALRAEGGRKLFLDLKLDQADVQHAVETAGFRYVGVGARGRIGLWVDRRAGDGAPTH